MSAALLTLLPLIQGAILAAPDAIAAGMKAVALIKALFEAGLITKAEQDDTFIRVNDWCASALRGERPPELVVDPDPS
jgi:hypothetical protein